VPGLPRPPSSRSRTRRRARSGRKGRRRWLRWLLGSLALVAIAAAGVTAGLYVFYARLIDERLHGERERTQPRVFARRTELRQGQAVSEAELAARLNALGYAERPTLDAPGEFTTTGSGFAIRPRTGPQEGKIVRVSFAPPAGGAAAAAIRAIEVDGSGQVNAVVLDAPQLTALLSGAGRERRRNVPLETIPAHLRHAVLAIEDQSFYSHPGINPFRLVAAAITNTFGDRRAPVGNSTLTQQLARMFFQADEFNAELQRGSRSYLRYLQGAFMSMVLERRASKNEILELYLNDVYLGQRGSFAIHGVAEAARVFFGKDVANVTVSEAALMAGVIQSPASRSPFSNAERARDRRNVVINAMAREGYLTAEEAARAIREPIRVVTRSVDNEAPYFIDVIRKQLGTQLPGLTARPGALDIYTTLDLNLQRLALDAVRRGLTRVDEMLARRKRPPSAQAALLAVDPRTGDILAMVGGRSYNQSQFNRAVDARRQPGSIFKPFVFLAAFELAARDGRTDLTPASIANDEPRVIEFNGRAWEPKNYDEYDGPITWRNALARSRNLATVDVGEQIGFDTVARLWRRVGVGTPPQAVPSITLGVFELTPYEVAQAYTLFVTGGIVRPLRGVERIESDGRPVALQREPAVRVSRTDTTYLVTNMMRGVLDGGTGASARAAGFSHDAAGKTGTTNDLRDAWFAGFTPDLLTVVWVGYDDNRPLTLSGSQAALPIWTDFMKSAMAGRARTRLEAPEEGISYAEIDPETGKLATPACRASITEAFLTGTEPTEWCALHP
jgi:penicillin-binding protein 1B